MLRQSKLTMPPRRLPKGKGRGKTSTPGPLATKGFYAKVDDTGEVEPVQPVVLDKDDSTSVEDLTNIQDTEETTPKETPPKESPPLQPKRLGRKKKGSEERHFLFTVEEEDDLIEWWRDNSFLYDPTHPSHLDKGKKWRFYEEKAKDFGCTSKLSK